MAGLREYFEDVVGKVLTAVEVDKIASNQREINGVSELRRFFGQDEARGFPLTWVDFDSIDQELVPTMASWYDARAAHPTRTEWRLYLSPKLLSTLAVGTLVVFARTPDEIFVFSSRSEAGKIQMSRLFSLNQEELDFQRPELEAQVLLAAQQLVLARLGIERFGAPDLRELVVTSFGREYPPGVEFSEFARSNTFGVDPLADPDGALVAWMRTELEMFTALESHIEAEAMASAKDLDDRLKIAMSVFQRRKSRAGKAFEYHLRALLDAHDLSYSHNPVTERKEEPDFVFPSIEDYLNVEFPASRLTMLGAKQTVRDRWRQVLSEADRVATKHLATIDSQLSASQVREMVASGVQPVLPIEIQVEYGGETQDLMMSVREFLDLIEVREGAHTIGT